MTESAYCFLSQDDPLNNECAQHYKDNLVDAQRVSREWTEKYAVLDA
jgi:ubiquitin-protein ligase